MVAAMGFVLVAGGNTGIAHRWIPGYFDCFQMVPFRLVHTLDRHDNRAPKL